MEDFSKLQDDISQLPLLKSYTQIVLGFPLSPTTSDESVVAILQRAADQLTAAFPWLAAHVVHDGAGPGKTGIAKIVPFASPSERPVPLVNVKDCRALLPSFADIISAGGPMSMLDGEVLTTRTALPASYDTAVEPAPVLCIQANFVKGGLLLAFASQHNAVDMNGQAQMIRLFGKACRGEKFTDAEVEGGNMDRRNVIKLLGPEEKGIDLTPFLVVPKESASAEEKKPAPTAQWAYYHFPGPKLAQLKSIASSAPSTTTATSPWVSTDDVLSAFVAQHVFSARHKRLGAPPNTKATVCRAVNGRRFLDPPLPPTYAGHMVYCHDTSFPLDSAMATSDVGALARQLRADLSGITALAIRSLTTAIAADETKTKVGYGATLDITRYALLMSSWSGTGLYATEFGPLGKPALAKRERFGPLEGLVYLMPRTEAGDIDVAICLAPEDIETLKADEEFMGYAKYIG